MVSVIAFYSDDTSLISLKVSPISCKSCLLKKRPWLANLKYSKKLNFFCEGSFDQIKALVAIDMMLSKLLKKLQTKI